MGRARAAIDDADTVTFRAELARVTEERDAAVRANRAKSDLLGYISHEIRTPLNMVLGLTELLGETPLDAKQRNHVAALRRAGERLLALSNDILDVARIEAGSPLEIASGPLDLRSLAEGAIDRVATAAARKGLDLSLAISPHLPRTVVGDARRIGQVLASLLGNAVKFTSEGSVRLVVEPGGDAVRFSVHDTGIGIAPENRDAIFAGFVRGDAAHSREGRAGLGLYIAKHVVVAMGGRIWVEENAGAGSVFHVSLHMPATSASGASHEPIRAPHSRPLRVLLVDDSEDGRAIVAEFLRPSGAIVDTAGDSDAALAKLRSEPFDVVIMDVHLPGRDGFATTTALRRIERELGRRPVPVIALSADARADSVNRALAVGCVAHLAKPIEKAALLEALERYAGRTSAVGAKMESHARALLPKFLANRARDVGRIREALDKRDFDAAATLGHNMHGNGVTYGLAKISTIGRRLEAAAKAKSAARVRTCADELEAYLATNPEVDDVPAQPSATKRTRSGARAVRNGR